tara:strand:- start:326 stop:1669 length:1344 start_codon:yes stop_codon:yes gene_type:complete
MNILGLNISRKKSLNAPQGGGGWRRLIREPFSGAWQRNQEERVGDVMCYPTLFACISRVSQDVAKLPFKLMRKENGIWQEVENPAYSRVLRKPNHYQTAQQFRESWVLSRVTQGNAYILKQRDDRGVVSSLYVLDPWRVQPLVSDSGDVFYELFSAGWENLPPLPSAYAGDSGNVIVPAREVIHDRANTFHHPLIGIPPLCAAHWPSVKNMKILKSSSQFFGNGAQPGGILTAPAGIRDAQAKEIKEYWDENFKGDNSGKVAVIGADMKYQSFSMKAIDSQMVEQMKYSDEQICQAFGIAPYKIGINNPPSGWKADDVNVEYYGDALSPIMESMENLLDEGLGISRPLGIELDTSPLWRMDEGKLAEVENTLVSGKIKTPDEARRSFNLPATGGGDTLWGQHQDYPLGYLAQRDDLNQAASVLSPEPDSEDQARAFFGAIEKRFSEA